MKYTREVLADAAARSKSVAEVMRVLGARPSGGLHAHLRRKMTAFGINTDHFLGQGHARGTSPRRTTPAEILVPTQVEE